MSCFEGSERVDVRVASNAPLLPTCSTVCKANTVCTTGTQYQTMAPTTTRYDTTFCPCGSHPPPLILRHLLIGFPWLPFLRNTMSATACARPSPRAPLARRLRAQRQPPQGNNRSDHHARSGGRSPRDPARFQVACLVPNLLPDLLSSLATACALPSRRAMTSKG